jgi:hypothetical protein
MDGGSADIAGANIGPYILYIAALAHCRHGCRYLGFVGNEIPPCARGIPYILYIKTPNEWGFRGLN